VVRFSLKVIGLTPALVVTVALWRVATFAQSVDVRQVRRSFLEQPGCPLNAVRGGGSAFVLKNVSDKQIASYALACFTRTGKKYKPITTFDASEGSIDPGGFTSEGGFDAAPPNACRSRKSLVGVATVRFADESSWLSPLLKPVHEP
jgi:hypothetical protein